MLAANSASFGSAGTADFNGHTVNQEMGFLSNNGIGETLLQFLGFKAEPAPPSLLFEQPAKPKRPAPAMPAPETAAVPKNERRLKPVWFNLSSDIQLSLIKAVSRLPFRRPSVTG